MNWGVSEPVTTYNQLLGELETALKHEAEERTALADAKDSLAYEEAIAAKDSRALARDTARKVTEAEIAELVRTSSIVVLAEDHERSAQYAYDLAKAQVEVARHRIAFALAAFKNVP